MMLKDDIYGTMPYKDTVKRKACREKYKAIARASYKKFILDYKLSHPCECGEKHPACLHFHHMDSKLKEFTISECVDMSIDSLKIEIAKCKVLCANCHAKLHWRETILKGTNHG